VLFLCVSLFWRMCNCMFFWGTKYRWWQTFKIEPFQMSPSILWTPNFTLISQ